MVFKRTMLAFLGTLMLCSAVTLATPYPAKKLSSVRNQIHRLEKNLHTTKVQQKKLKHSLKQDHLKLVKIIKQIQTTQNRLKHTKYTLHQQHTKTLTYQQKIEEQQALLAKQISALSLLHPSPALKILFNQEQPEQYQRDCHYIQDLNDERLLILQHLQKITTTLDQKKQQTTQQVLFLKKARHQETTKRSVLKQAQSHRKSQLKQTEQKLHGTAAQLKKLRRDEARLETILKTLSSQKQEEQIIRGRFHPLQGNLTLPVDHGQIIQYFGQPLISDQLKSNGMLIAAPLGTKVHALSDGKVVYADWLRGFGLLVIIQHGEHYMTLYGRNQNLYVRTGQKVHVRDIISTVGNSGGFSQNALYFEVRHHGHPINPAYALQNKTPH